MTTIRTIADLIRHDVRSIKRGRYEILAIETRHHEQGDTIEILCNQENPRNAIREDELPILTGYAAGSAKVRLRLPQHQELIIHKTTLENSACLISDGHSLRLPARFR